MRTVDLRDRKFGRLTVIEQAGFKVTPKGQRKKMWRCLCECGNTVTVSHSSLVAGDTKSCGCLSKSTPRHKTHGQTGTKIYSIYNNMKNRCYRKQDKRFAQYGGRGIGVCDEWRDDFQAFYDWAMAHGYEDGLTLDRIDVNGDYCPDNCRWVTQKEQQNNRQTNHLVTYQGTTKTIAQWAEERKIKYSTLERRINSYHWDIARALNTK